jgi:hypothetical protein
VVDARGKDQQVVLLKLNPHPLVVRTPVPDHGAHLVEQALARPVSGVARGVSVGEYNPKDVKQAVAGYGGRDPEHCLRFAVACGAESTQHFGAGVLEQREVERLLPEVRVETFEAPAIQVG